jgi:hypothetical protein
MRRYDDPVDVRKGWVTGVEGPEQFLWHGRLWKVRAVLAHWVETAPWWQSSGVRAVVGSDEADPRATPDADGTTGGMGGTTGGADGTTGGDLLVERELWRVEAGAGRAVSRGSDDALGNGVFDLSFDGAAGAWVLVGCAD